MQQRGGTADELRIEGGPRRIDPGVQAVEPGQGER
jgi:hypothetical protein